MKFVFVAIAFFTASVCHADFKPDLRATLTVTGTIVRTVSGDFDIPVLVSVMNSGNEIAGKFKMGLFYINQSFPGTRPGRYASISSPDGAFTQDPNYVWSARALFPGRTISFRAIVRLPKTLPRGTQVQIQVQSDVCWGEEFMPDFCRINESNELNNISNVRAVMLP